MSPPPGPERLPRVLLSSVVRSTHQGESHGGVYLVDFGSSEVEQLLDWDDPSISWEGRGADRGLRGIAFHHDRVFLAASDEIFVYDRGFSLLGSFRNRYLKHCHEIFVEGDRLFLSSTGFDSVLEYDLRAEAFVRGWCLRFGSAWRARRRLRIRPRPRLRAFDPEAGAGPSPGDTCHVNSVFAKDGVLYVAGVGLGTLFAIRDARLERYAKIPYGTHNARPFREGVLMNHTATDRVAYASREGSVLGSFPIPRYDPGELLNASLPSDLARQAFGRGLAVASEDLFVAGSSPATVTAYRFDPPGVLRSINVSMDVRNAVHGLEIWPTG
ncbi:MAG: hypothetical protein HY240_10870 [Actinobacteria bacterium]|nr:hypothetical protein [Actinomycetota bacterium]